MEAIFPIQLISFFNTIEILEQKSAVMLLLQWCFSCVLILEDICLASQADGSQRGKSDANNRSKTEVI